MAHQTDDVGWLWVVIQSQDGEDQLVGQHLEGEENAFIPAFRSRDEAENARPLLALAPGGVFEVQAMQRDELVGLAVAHGFLVRLLTEAGEILEELTGKPAK
ncbi:MAG: hypothetical protein ACLFRG_09985 [Desulfococcaceae bacterium]